MLRTNFGFRLKYKSRSVLAALIGRYGGNGIYNLQGPTSQKGRHALIIYTAEALSKYLSNTLSSFPSMGSHSGFRESIELLNTLLDLGYTVDYLDLKETPAIHWDKYELVIDAGKNLQYSKPVTGQKKIYYATSCHWRLFYENAYRHTDSFYKRNQQLLYPDRELQTNYSDDAADRITCFGGSYQAKSFGPNSHKVRPLCISTTFSPGADFKKTIGSKTKFMWYGGHGPFHKGLDLAVDAFLKMPDKELHIFGNIELNRELYKWFLKVTQQTKNIFYHGWVTPDSKAFHDYAQMCDAVVFASSSEGGAGAIIQCLQFGLIPIINASTAIDLENTQFNISGLDPEEQISSMTERVQAFSASSVDELQQYSQQLAQQYSQQNNIEAYARSLRAVIAEN